MPTAQPFGSAGTTIYEGEKTFSLPPSGSGKGEVKCSVSWQCCDDHVCMPPATREFTFTL